MLAALYCERAKACMRLKDWRGVCDQASEIRWIEGRVLRDSGLERRWTGHLPKSLACSPGSFRPLRPLCCREQWVIQDHDCTRLVQPYLYRSQAMQASRVFMRQAAEMAKHDLFLLCQALERHEDAVKELEAPCMPLSCCCVLNPVAVSKLARIIDHTNC